MTTPLLSVESLDVTYGSGRKAKTPVRDVSLSVDAGETLGIVGESGSGKSSVGRAILGLAHASSGRIVFQGEDITHATRQERRKLASDLQVVFQDPRSSLNEAKTVGDILAEPLIVNRTYGRRQSRDRAAHLIEAVGLTTAALDKYPGAFSGGQRQRIAIARALMPEPKLVICDEPVSALDLSVQAQIINLFRQLQRETGVSYLFVAHDLSVVRLLCTRVAVMSGGRVIEQGNTEQVYQNPSAEYTKRLLAAEPYPDPDIQQQRRRAWDLLAAGQ